MRDASEIDGESESGGCTGGWANLVVFLFHRVFAVVYRFLSPICGSA